MERIQATQGLLRVKKEEELQEVAGSGNTDVVKNGVSEVVKAEVTNKNTDTGAETAAIPSLTAFLSGRGASPPPEDWKPLDKCYFCLDGKLSHDDQAPLVSPSKTHFSCNRISRL